MKDKVWEINYEGHLIRMRNKMSLIPLTTSEVLEIDNVVIKHVKGSFLRMYSTIIAVHGFKGVEKKVEVRVAQKASGFGTGARVYVDGQFVGGDESIQYPDPEEAIKQYKKGYPRYFFTVGLLRFGLPFAVMMSIINMGEPVLTIVWKFAFHAIFFGAFMSYFSWQSIKSMVQLRGN